ncbi:uncharacterized protein A4U43_C06F13110 [Asparagus officinalis]|uniref:Uncharacterized protein n=1 Tax=Asparagus officinalis TaxID=4686 RepID=A0A5P1EQ11_ASPOF|nr:uncharacterized protein A4U43_C06F13110 [Asparagus officinalis]
MGPPQHQDASSDLDSTCDGFGDDEIEHEMMSGSSQSEITCKKDYEKPGRHGSEEKTKVPPKGYQGILEWKGNIPVGDWADHYCLEDNLEYWDYVILRMAKLIRDWKSDLKKRYFTKVSANWKRIYKLDKRVSI